MSSLAKTNEDIAVAHMQLVVIAIKAYRRAPTETLRGEFAIKARVNATLLRQLAQASNDPTLHWAANEAASLIRIFGLEAVKAESVQG